MFFCENCKSAVNLCKYNNLKIDLKLVMEKNLLTNNAMHFFYFFYTPPPNTLRDVLGLLHFPECTSSLEAVLLCSAHKKGPLLNFSIASSQLKLWDTDLFSIWF